MPTWDILVMWVRNGFLGKEEDGPTLAAPERCFLEKDD